MVILKSREEMKKIVIAGMLTIAVSLFAEVNMNKTEVVDSIGLAGFKKSLSVIDKAAAGRWYLLRADRRKFNKVRGDEFEIDDAITSAYSKFTTKVKEESFVGKASVLRLGAEFSKYDFKKKQFPISAMSKDSYISFNGSKLVGGGGMQLSFNNVNDTHSFLPMVKDDAKKFMKARKDSVGNIDRRVTAKYSYIIKSIESPAESINSCNERYRGCHVIDNVKVIGHITKLEILDKDGKVLHTYSDYK